MNTLLQQYSLDEQTRDFAGQLAAAMNARPLPEPSPAVGARLRAQLRQTAVNPAPALPAWLAAVWIALAALLLLAWAARPGVTLHWEQPAGQVDYFLLYRAAAQNAPPELLAEIPPERQAFHDYAPPPAGRTAYWLAAVQQGRETALSPALVDTRPAWRMWALALLGSIMLGAGGGLWLQALRAQKGRWPA